MLLKNTTSITLLLAVFVWGVPALAGDEEKEAQDEILELKHPHLTAEVPEGWEVTQWDYPADSERGRIDVIESPDETMYILYGSFLKDLMDPYPTDQKLDSLNNWIESRASDREKGDLPSALDGMEFENSTVIGGTGKGPRGEEVQFVKMKLEGGTDIYPELTLFFVVGDENAWDKHGEDVASFLASVKRITMWTQ